MNKSLVFGYGMMALLGVMWGVHAPAIKLALAAGFTFPQLVFWEYVVGSTVFGIVMLWEGGRFPRSGWFWRRMLAASVIGCGVPLFLFWSYKLGPVSIGATLLFLYMPFTQLLNFLFKRRVPRGREMAAAGLVIAGAVLAANFVGVVNAENLRGAPFAVLAAFCFAAFFVLTAELGGQATAAFRSWVCCAGSCVLMGALAAVAGWSLQPALPSTEVAVAWIVGLGVLGQVIPVFLLVHFGPRVGSGLGSLLTATELPVAVGLSALLLGDTLGLTQIGGMVLVLAGIVLPHLPGRRLAVAELRDGR